MAFVIFFPLIPYLANGITVFAQSIFGRVQWYWCYPLYTFKRFSGVPYAVFFSVQIGHMAPLF